MENIPVFYGTSDLAGLLTPYEAFDRIENIEGKVVTLGLGSFKLVGDIGDIVDLEDLGGFFPQLSTAYAENRVHLLIGDGNMADIIASEDDLNPATPPAHFLHKLDFLRVVDDGPRRINRPGTPATRTSWPTRPISDFQSASSPRTKRSAAFFRMALTICRSRSRSSHQRRRTG